MKQVAGTDKAGGYTKAALMGNNSIKIKVFPFFDVKTPFTEIDQNLSLICRINVPEFTVGDRGFLSPPSLQKALSKQTGLMRRRVVRSLRG
jgi:hypothetical protein